MLKFFGTKRIKPKSFDYKPRFYDPDKEALEARLKRKANNQKGALTKMRLRREFEHYKSDTGSRKKGSFLSSSSFRLIVLVVLLSIISYKVLEEMLPQLMQHWFPMEHQEYEILN